MPIAAAKHQLLARDRWVHRLFGVTECLAVRRVTADVPSLAPTARRNADKSSFRGEGIMGYRPFDADLSGRVVLVTGAVAAAPP
jgi:hypothetical protein